MAGRPGRSGGWNRLTPEEHARRGTKLNARHRRPAALALVGEAVKHALQPIPPAVIEGLTGRGLDFVHDCWRRYSGWAPGSLVLLRESGFVVNACEQLRGEKGERQAQRMLLALLDALNLER